MRTFGIWFFDLLAAAAIGAMAGNYIQPDAVGWMLGMIAGMCLFACVRLLLEQ